MNRLIQQSSPLILVIGLSVAIIAGIGLLVLGCSDSQREIIKAKATLEGHLIFDEWNIGGQNKQALLKNGYGMMIFYDVSQEDKGPRFEFYVHKDLEVIRTSSLSQFKKELARISLGETLHYYNTCAGGIHHALDPRFLEEIKTFCKQRGILFQKGDEEVYSICTCL